MPLMTGMAVVFRWLGSGRYVADARCQEQLFGPVPMAGEALVRFADERRTAPVTDPSPVLAARRLTRTPRAYPWGVGWVQVILYWAIMPMAAWSMRWQW